MRSAPGLQKIVDSASVRWAGFAGYAGLDTAGEAGSSSSSHSDWQYIDGTISSKKKRSAGGGQIRKKQAASIGHMVMDLTLLCKEWWLKEKCTCNEEQKPLSVLLAAFAHSGLCI